MLTLQYPAFPSGCWPAGSNWITSKDLDSRAGLERTIPLISFKFVLFGIFWNPTPLTMTSCPVSLQANRARSGSLWELHAKNLWKCKIWNAKTFPGRPPRPPPGIQDLDVDTFLSFETWDQISFIYWSASKIAKFLQKRHAYKSNLFLFLKYIW